MRKYKLIVSDLHAGAGHDEGNLNPLESFNLDARFCEFLRYHSSGYFADDEVELIINGDFYDLLQVPVEDARDRFPLRIDEARAVEKARACMDGHPEIHAGLAAFLSMPNKSIMVIPGNHDFEWIFEGVQRLFRTRLTGSPDDSRIRFITDEPHYEFDGIQIQHGQQFELMHRHNYREKLIMRRRGNPVLNLPWGSQYLLKVMTRLKQHRPYIDRVRPFRAYLIRAMIFDPLFFLRVCWLSTYHFLKTRVFNLRDFGARMRQNWQLLTEAEVYPDLYLKVRHVFDENPRLHTIVLGHTHVPLVRRLRCGRYYINSGCWTDTVSLDLGSFALRSSPTYVFIEYPEEEGPPSVRLREWNGTHNLFQDLLF